MTVERPLTGGMDPAAGVVRVGDTVRRPTTPSSDAIRALLLHLERAGFEGAPRYLGTDEQGRQVLSYIEGEVPLPPYPARSMTETALAEFGRLLRRLHEATAAADLTGLSGWSREAAGNPVWAGFWRESHGEERAASDDAWLERHRAALVEAIRSAPGNHP